MGAIGQLFSLENFVHHLLGVGEDLQKYSSIENVLRSEILAAQFLSMLNLKYILDMNRYYKKKLGKNFKYL